MLYQTQSGNQCLVACSMVKAELAEVQWESALTSWSQGGNASPLGTSRLSTD